ncbi:unnamed protein product [Dicrocoelium dendriticum]|nr:unnamed protein product [Dicrocoelium dendriticum]
MRDHSAPLRDAEHFLTKFPGVQSAFAGFSFSSPYPSHLSLLSGLHVAPHNFTLSLNAGTSCPPLVNGITTSDSSGPSHPSRRKPDLPSQATPLPPPLHPEQSEQPVLDDPVFCKSQLTRVQSQLDDALLMVELHSSEVVNLTQQLEKSETLRRELESQLAQHEASHRITMEEAERRAETVQMEVQTSLARLEAELAEWKAIAQSKQIVRDLQQDTGSTTLAFTTAQLSIRSVEVVDSVSASEMFASMSCATPSILELNRESQTPITTTDTAPSPDHVAHSTLSSPGLVHLNSHSDRVEQLARRAHRAEVLAREAADMLEAEQHFCRLYKETSAEKSDQLKELTRELAETRELLSASQKDSRRYYEECEAARRALDEEQLRSRRHREAARAADERSISASQRAALARREAANLRDSLELMKQAYETEKAKCSAAVNKLTELQTSMQSDAGSQVMSGSNTGALELMYIASAAQSKDTSGTFYLGNAATRHKLALILGNRQQQQMSNQAREIKRLLNEIKRLNAELAMSKRENLNLQAALAAADRVVDEAHFQRLQHSRENSDDLIMMDVQRAMPSSFVQARSRSGLFGLGKTQVRSADSGMVLSRCSSTSKSLIGAEREDALASSSSEASTSRATLPRQNSTGEPFSFIGSRTVMQTEAAPRIPSPLSPDWGDFTLAGVLEYGRRQPRRKKLFWSPRVVKLTSAHLTVWNYTPDTIGILDSGPRHSSMNRAGHAPTSGTVPPALLEVPLRALYHVRQLDQSDAIHEHPEQLATIFNIAYDRFFSDDSPSNYVTMSGVVGVGGQQHSLTLPRKLSFGSSAHFTTVHNPHPPLTDKHPQCSGDSINMRRSVVGSSHGHLDTITSNNSTSRAPSSKAQSISISPHVILVRGHKLHHIRFPRMAVCDLCRKACWQLVSPPPAFQCILCQLKFHATHLNTQDYAIPACGKAIVSLVFRCASSTEREKWVRCIRAAMQFTKMNSPAANPTTATSSADYHSSTAHRCLPLDSDPAATTHEMFAFARAPSVAAAEVPVPSYSPVFPLDDMLHNGDHSDHSERLSDESSARTVAECQLESASSTADSGAMATADHCAMNGNHRFDHNGGNHGS